MTIFNLLTLLTPYRKTPYRKTPYRKYRNNKSRLKLNKHQSIMKTSNNSDVHPLILILINYNLERRELMIGGKLIGFILISSMSGLAYLKYSQLTSFNKKVNELVANNELRKYLFQSCEDSSYFIDDMMNNFESEFNQSHVNSYKKTILKFTEGNVLETCAGSNRTLKFYPSGTKLTLIDWSPKMVSIGITKSLPTIQYNYVIGNVLQMPFKDNQFDTVVDIFGLEYVDKPQEALSQMRRVCKKGGTIILMNVGLSDIVEFHWWENAVSGMKLYNMGVFTNRNWEKIIREFDFEVRHLERKKNGKIYIHILNNVKLG